jgi:ligand-binding sensor domain-containing protein/signal transduction histidine kinase
MAVSAAHAQSEGPVEAVNPDYLLRVWDADSGLPHGTVTSIAQTPDGYLWVGTASGGLARFDGEQFVSLGPVDDPALKSLKVKKLIVDARGTLWVSMVDGNVLSYRRGKFHTEFQETRIPPSGLATVLEGEEGDVLLISDSGGMRRGRDSEEGYRWEIITPQEALASSGVGLDRERMLWYRTKNHSVGRMRVRDSQQLSRPTLPSGLRVNALTADREQRIWLGTSNGLAMWNGSAFDEIPLPAESQDQAVMQVAPADDGAMWMRTGGGFLKYDAGKWLIPGPWKGPPISRMREIGLFPDREGGLWISSYGQGLWHIDSGGRTVEVDWKDGLPNKRIECWYEDREGNVWVGLTGSGLVRVRPPVFHTVWPRESMRYQAASSICEDAAGVMWFGTTGNTILSWKDEILKAHTPPAGVVRGLEFVVWPHATEGLWVGSQHVGLLHFNGRDFKAPFPPAEISAVAHVLYMDRKGALWIGNGFGLFCWSEGRLKSFGPAENFTAAFVLSITEDKNGDLWVGTALGELRRYRDGRFETFRPADSLTDEAAVATAAAHPVGERWIDVLFGGERFWALHADADGVIWIGTLGGGLLRFENGRFTRFTPRDGLPSEHVSQILEDDEGQLWLGTRKGIARVRKSGLAAGSPDFITYGKADGLPALECSEGNQPACWRGRDGRLWFSTVKGVAWVDPKTVPHNPLLPPVMLEGLLVDGQEMLQNRKTPNSLIVPAGNHHVEFKFTALSFTSPEGMRFKWRLAGLEQVWKTGMNTRKVTYPFVPAGNYQFQVQACNNDGVWNPVPTVLALEVLPYFWQRPAFRIAAVALILVLLLALGLYLQRRRHQARLRIVERQHALERERTRIARDIHDQVGANLTKVGKLNEALIRNFPASDPHHPVILTMADTTREIVRTMDEIVWAVNPRNDTLDNVVNYIVHYAEEFLGSSGVACELDVPFVFPSRPVTAEVRHNLFMAVREALNNSVKSGQPTRVIVKLAMTGQALSVALADDGCGFDPSRLTGHRNGLENLRKRMEAVSGSFLLESAPGQGTQVTLTVPIHEHPF